MVAGVVDQAVVREDDPLGPAAACPGGVDVALGPFAARRVWQKALVVAEEAAADALAGRVGLQRAAGPAQVLGLLFGDVVAGQVTVGVDIEGDLVLGIVPAVLGDPFLDRVGGRGRFGLRRLRGAFSAGLDDKALSARSLGLPCSVQQDGAAAQTEDQEQGQSQTQQLFELLIQGASTPFLVQFQIIIASLREKCNGIPKKFKSSIPEGRRLCYNGQKTSGRKPV